MNSYNGGFARKHVARGSAFALAATLLTLPATGAARGATTSAPTACEIRSGAVMANGSVRFQSFAATSPPTTTIDRIETPGLFRPGQVRLSTSIDHLADYADGSVRSGWMVMGSAMYSASWFVVDQTNEVKPGSFKTTRVGGGWAPFTAIETSRYADTQGFGRTTQYGLWEGRTIFRWTVDAKGLWHSAGMAPNFHGVKAMALISQTKTYDTFLANTSSGALYTIHIPTTMPMKPIVKKVRGSTWQGFESLQARRCGQYGVLLLGIDQDTGAGHLYAVGHANGLSTVIKGLGKVPTTLKDPLYFYWSNAAGYAAPPYGE